MKKSALKYGKVISLTELTLNCICVTILEFSPLLRCSPRRKTKPFCSSTISVVPLLGLTREDGKSTQFVYVYVCAQTLEVVYPRSKDV